MRKRTLALVLIGVLATASAAFAGFTLFGGVTGSSSDQPIAAAQSSFAVTISGNGTAPALDAGGTASVPLKVTNLNTNAAETVTALTPSFTTKNASGTDDSSTCASFFSAFGGQDDGTIVGVPIPASGSITGHFQVGLAANTPVSCASGSYKVSFTGTTNP